MMKPPPVIQKCKPHEIVPGALREYLRWDHRHDAMSAQIIKEFSLKLPRDGELIRQLAFVRVAQAKPPADFEEAHAPPPPIRDDDCMERP